MEQRIFIISNKEQIEEKTIYFRIRSLERIFRIQRCERGTDREVSATVKLYYLLQNKQKLLILLIVKYFYLI